MNRQVQLRPDNDEHQRDGSSSDGADSVKYGAEKATPKEGTDRSGDENSDLFNADSDSGTNLDAFSDVSEDSIRPNESLKDVSFGALAEAQAAFPPAARKRKAPPEFDNDKTHKEQQADGDAPQKQSQTAKQPKSHRQSKHAPTVLSSKQQVSRRRDLFEPSRALKSRDPRFDPTIQASNHDRNVVDKANRDYSFLTSYQAAEILEMKARIQKTKEPHAAAELKRQVMSIESKLRNAQARQRERDILSQHKRQERAAIAAGEKAKPYYLKESEVKKMAHQERLDGMSKGARDKAASRKQKREKTKDARSMPRVRRE